MRYIKKISTPKFFEDDTKNFVSWNDYDKDETTKEKRQNLRSYILENEQNFLCIYCEKQVNLYTSHIEHIKPKSIYKDLTFEYTNLTVSCNGVCENDKSEKNYCGHKKDNEYYEDKFLDPTKVENISKYFIFEKSGEIKESQKEPLKAKYMIETLKLNDETLKLARNKALKKLNEEAINLAKKMKKTKKELIKKSLNSNRPKPFITFLRYIYKDLINA